ncbi:MAG: glycosyltransferase family 39 protein [Gammaproteobacteria bacterium]|mgnify:CR=1 FL=1|nr:glycosyltransferase family 39 protein [Gammaproteobacteria bacterium]
MNPGDDAARLFRPGAVGRAEVIRDLWLILLPAALLLAAGLGLRDPWPADEPRFALIAREMVATGQWLFPQVGGDWYQDKPPVFFWFIASIYWLTGWLRLAFLLPSLISALGTLALVYDLGRRVWSREQGLAAALLLAFSLQLVVQARAAQIDMTLVFFTTAGLYGIGRHLLCGPDWRAYTLGGLACGIGVITKGTGFLPLLAVLPFFALRRLGFQFGWDGRGGARWLLALAAALGGICLWFVPMMLSVALSGDPRLAEYRDGILFQQTITRYANAWHHHAPWYFFLVSVIPGLWLPGTALLPWFLPAWRERWRARDPRPFVFLGWVLLVVLFFSISTGKRGVYVLPALPAFALAAGAMLPALWRRPGVQRVGFAMAGVLALFAAGAAVYFGIIRPDKAQELADRYDVVSLAPLVAIATAALVLLIWLRPARGLVAWAGTVAAVLVVQGFWINPMINGARSGRDFVAAVEQVGADADELALVGYKEQYLLYFTRPVISFGYRRWRTGGGDDEDAAAWVTARPGRWVLVEDARRAKCFAGSPARHVGDANRLTWYLVSAPADADCVKRGDGGTARSYGPYRGHSGLLR